MQQALKDPRHCGRQSAYREKAMESRGESEDRKVRMPCGVV